jgi:hypothetical protein
MPPCITFLEYEKAFERVHHQKLWNILMARGVPVHLLKAIKSLCANKRIFIDIRQKVSALY